MKLFFAMAVACLLLNPAPGQGQTVVEVPIMGSQSTETEVQAQQPTEDAYRILVIGDALAGGLGAGLTRMAEPEPGFEIVNRFQEVSGIARPEVYDWAENLPNIMEDKDFKAVVVLLGANDRQSIRSGDFRHVFNTPDWLAAYKAQTDQLLDVLVARNVKIFWVAIPPMGDALYDADMKILAALQKQEVQAKGATYVDLRPAFLASDGTYTDTGEDDTGVVRKLRARDGVTFFKQGNNRFGQLLLAAIKKDMDVKPDQTVPQSATTSPPFDGEAIPMFGQDVGDGKVATFQPEKASTPEASKLAINKSSVSRADISPGSTAEKLFVQGEAAPAPAGRFDDFSYAKPAE
jgi:uncharacterized protein